MKVLILITFLTIMRLVLGQGFSKELAMKETQRLYTDLMTNYNKNLKPSDRVVVQFAFDLSNPLKTATKNVK